ncbi:hypothetical protein [Sphingobium sp.]|uniref:hypothetical protein n=1 Tax=Sphingobium sp. TaxID=1912891 RepID=UPI003B3A6709
MHGKSACHIRFIYAGRAEEDLLWEEACASVTTSVATQADLEKWGKWARLDSFAQTCVTALPQGKVLYVEGSASASAYPVGTSGSTYDMPVAD